MHFLVILLNLGGIFLSLPIDFISNKLSVKLIISETIKSCKKDLRKLRPQESCRSSSIPIEIVRAMMILPIDMKIARVVPA